MLSPDGAWNWCLDPRAVYVEGEFRRTHAGWMTHDGRLQIGSYDHADGSLAYFTLKEKWDVDDHNSNTFLALPDKRLLVFYARHNQPGLYCRKSSRPENVLEWGPEITVSNTPRISYNHPVYLSEEGRFYVFWRGPTWKPTFSSSSDGEQWAASQVLLREKGQESDSIRPYVKVVSDGKSAIHFAFTENHPAHESNNSIYYLKYEKGRFYRADGTPVGDMNHLPIRHGATDKVYDCQKGAARAWIWDVALDRVGRPVIAYIRFPNERDHRYHYARWTGQEWFDVEIVKGGGWFPQTPPGKRERELYYSGGLTLDHSDPSVVYLSRPVGGVFEIEKWKTEDGGKTWASRSITRDSKSPNVRPFVPWGYRGKEDHVLWMHGEYVHYTKYSTSIRMRVGSAN